MNLTTRQLHLLIASMEGSMSRMHEGCPIWDEVDALYTALVMEVMSNEPTA